MDGWSWLVLPTVSECSATWVVTCTNTLVFCCSYQQNCMTSSCDAVLQAVVEEMNRLGMIVDVSHASWDTALTVMKHSKAPVIFSHSSSYFICKHHRNVPDWLLHELVRKTKPSEWLSGGIVRESCGDNEKRKLPRDVARHLIYNYNNKHPLHLMQLITTV